MPLSWRNLVPHRLTRSWLLVSISVVEVGLVTGIVGKVAGDVVGKVGKVLSGVTRLHDTYNYG